MLELSPMSVARVRGQKALKSAILKKYGRLGFETIGCGHI
jgi:hypothetical protein